MAGFNTARPAPEHRPEVRAIILAIEAMMTFYFRATVDWRSMRGHLGHLPP